MKCDDINEFLLSPWPVQGIVLLDGERDVLCGADVVSNEHANLQNANLTEINKRCRKFIV